MTVVVVMMFMATSVTSITLMKINGKCASLQKNAALGVLLTVDTCNKNDPKQTNWEGIVVGKSGSKDKTLACIKGTDLCAGYKQVGNVYQKQQQLLKKDATSLAQQWVSADGLPYNGLNLGIQLCDEAVDGFIEGRECRDTPAQQWTNVEM
jgi:hypothetical protein